jgi:hypothetical protein
VYDDVLTIVYPMPRLAPLSPTQVSSNTSGWGV